MNIPIPAETPDPNIDKPTLPPSEPPPVPRQEPAENTPPPKGDPPSSTEPIIVTPSVGPSEPSMTVPSQPLSIPRKGQHHEPAH